MRLHFEGIDLDGKVYSEIVDKVRGNDLGFVFEHDDMDTEQGVVVVLSYGVVDVVHTSGGLTFVTIHARASDMMMIIKMLKDIDVDLGKLKAEVMK